MPPPQASPHPRPSTRRPPSGAGTAGRYMITRPCEGEAPSQPALRLKTVGLIPTGIMAESGGDPPQRPPSQPTTESLLNHQADRRPGAAHARQIVDQVQLMPCRSLARCSSCHADRWPGVAHARQIVDQVQLMPCRSLARCSSCHADRWPGAAHARQIAGQV
jgi:hypothetical protein